MELPASPRDEAADCGEEGAVWLLLLRPGSPELSLGFEGGDAAGEEVDLVVFNL